MTKKKEKTDREKGIDAAMDALEKRYGEPILKKMSDAGAGVETFSSGRLDLDEILGGGYAVGKIIEIFAPEATGKTGLALQAIASIQSLGGVAAIVDTEHALNIEYCEQIGVNVDELLISQPDHGEQAFEVIRQIIQNGSADLIVVDSVAHITPLREIEGETGEAVMGLRARLMGQGLRQITGVADKVGCTVIFLNQLRDKFVLYGKPETTTGGNALKFAAYQRLDIRNKGLIKEGDQEIGFKQQIKCIKNKAGRPYGKITNDIIYGKGVDQMVGFIDACVSSGIIEKSGSWYSYDGTKLGNGIKNLRLTLEENPDLVDELKKKLKK